MIDGLLLVESLYAALVVMLLLVCYRYLKRPTLAKAVVLGAVTGLATLTRTEGILLAFFVVLPVLLRRPRAMTPNRGIAVGMAVLALVLVLLPWSIASSDRTGELVVFSSNTATESTNCASTYSGPLVGYWDPNCEGTSDSGFRYIREHWTELPRVMVFRLGRLLDVYRTEQNGRISTLIDGREITVTRYGQVLYFATIPFAIAGAVVLRKRGVPLAPLGGVVLTAVLTAMLVHGEIRFRVAAEVVMVLLAGCALDRLVSRPAQKSSGAAAAALSTDSKRSTAESQS